MEKEEAHFSVTQREKRATATKEYKDCLTSTGEPEHAQVSGSKGRGGSSEEADGSERGKVQEIAVSDALEPGRNGGRAEVEAICKLCATCHVEKERAYFSGTLCGASARQQRRGAKTAWQPLGPVNGDAGLKRVPGAGRAGVL